MHCPNSLGYVVLYWSVVPLPGATQKNLSLLQAATQIRWRWGGGRGYYRCPWDPDNHWGVLGKVIFQKYWKKIYRRNRPIPRHRLLTEVESRGHMWVQLTHYDQWDLKHYHEVFQQRKNKTKQNRTGPTHPQILTHL